MPNWDQLEIIGPGGEIIFYELDPARGVTNIGRDAENDVVITGPGVEPFHAVLDHRRKPYQVVILSATGGATREGEPVLPNVSTPLHPWDTLEMGGYTLMLLEGAGRAAPTEKSPAPAAPAPGAPVPLPRPAPASPLARPPDREDELILVELSEREWTLGVEQTAVCDVTLTNGGDIVAAFVVQVEGLDPRWVAITPPQINLNEGERASLTLTLTPPREPASRAGAHHLAVVVTSPDYPGRSSQRGATLTITPYYEFGVGELSPKQHTVSWRRRSGQTVLPMANRGNSRALLRVEAEDTERACSFEFQVPGETASLARQAEMRLPPAETFAIPIRMTPHARRLVGLRRRRYAFTVTASMPEGAQTPRAVMGQLDSKPLIGPGLLALALLTLAVFVALFFRPTIGEFYADPPVVLAGTPVALYWEASSFASLSIDGLGKVDGRSSQITVVPRQDTTYKLKAENLLSRLSPGWFGDSAQAAVAVTPVLPLIRVFSVDKEAILKGESITLRWEVVAADELILQAGSAAETLLSTEHVSQRTVAPDREVVYTLIARNRYGEVTDSLTVKVSEPTPTPTVPPPTPVIEFFRVEPNEITLGETVTFDWTVSGILDPQTFRVQLDPLGVVDQVGPKIYKPEQEGTLNFWLRAFNGEAEARRPQNVLVKPAPTGTPAPEKPTIAFFTAAPDEIVRGSGRDVQLAWSVTGATTDVQISGPGFGPIVGLPALGSLPVNPDQSTLYVLTAFNGELSASQTVQVKVLEPTPTGTPLPTAPPTPTPTSTPVPPNIVYFNVVAADTNDADKVVFVGGSPPTYEVVAGTQVNLQWLVQNALKVSLSVDDQSLGDQPFEGQLPQTVRAEGNYKLEARNVQDDLATAFVRIEMTQEIPPAPDNVSGEPLTDTVDISWEYRTQDENKIIGFRIYRADVPPGSNFQRVADEDDLDQGSRQWSDAVGVGHTCGKAYYVVAVYEDFNGDVQETDASENSWYSPPCSSPTSLFHGPGQPFAAEI